LRLFAGMALRKIPPGDMRWFLLWKPGGEIALVHAYGEGSLIDCPKCEAPMLFTRQLAICYACGTSFGAGGGLVSRPFARHSWPDPSAIRQDQAPEVVGCTQAGSSGSRTKDATPSWRLGEVGFTKARDPERDDSYDCDEDPSYSGWESQGRRIVGNQRPTGSCSTACASWLRADSVEDGDCARGWVHMRLHR